MAYGYRDRYTGGAIRYHREPSRRRRRAVREPLDGILPRVIRHGTEATAAAKLLEVDPRGRRRDQGSQFKPLIRSHRRKALSFIRTSWLRRHFCICLVAQLVSWGFPKWNIAVARTAVPLTGMLP